LKDVKTIFFANKKRLKKLKRKNVAKMTLKCDFSLEAYFKSSEYDDEFNRVLN